MRTQIFVAKVYIFNWALMPLAHYFSWWTNRPRSIFTTCRFAVFRFGWRFISTGLSIRTLLFLRRWLFFLVFWILTGFIAMANRLFVYFNLWVCHTIDWDFGEWSCTHQKFDVLSFVWIMATEGTYKHWGLFIVLFRHRVEVVTNVLNTIEQLFARAWHMALGTTFISSKFLWRRRRLCIRIDFLLIIYILIQIILKDSALLPAIGFLWRGYVYILNFCWWHWWLRLTCLTT